MFNICHSSILLSLRNALLNVRQQHPISDEEPLSCEPLSLDLSSVFDWTTQELAYRKPNAIIDIKYHLIFCINKEREE